MWSPNPYSGTHFFEFIQTFIKRFFCLFQKGPIASDELQILALTLISTSAAMVGVFLIYKKMTMLANALSHSVLFGIAITYLILRLSFQHINPAINFKAMMLAALSTGFLTAFLSTLISRISRLQKDAAIGLVFSTLFALGVILICLFSRNAHIGTELVVGNVDALHSRDLPNIFFIFITNFLLIALFFRGLKLSTFDPIFSHLIGLRLSFYHYLVIFLLSITAIGAFKAIGVVLVLSFFIVPPLTGRLFAHTLQKQILVACFVGALSSFIGVALSRHLLSVHQVALSTAGITVLTLYAVYFSSVAFIRIKATLLQIISKRSKALQPVLEGQKNTLA